MLYAKGKTSDGKEVSIELHRADIYTKCKVCGKEIPYDIVSAAALEHKQYGRIRIFGAVTICGKCYGKDSGLIENPLLKATSKLSERK